MNDILLGSQLRKRHEIKMLRLVIFVSILSLVHGLIKIESQPAKVLNRKFVKLVCDVGTMKSRVRWVYGGVTYFSCDTPYTNCYDRPSSRKDGYYDFSIKDNSLIAIFYVDKNQNDGIWSCYHGNDRANHDIDNADAVWIQALYLSHRVNPNRYEIRYRVRSTAPVDVLIYAEGYGYKGKRVLYDVKQSSLSDHTFNSALLCSDINIYCKVTNGFGPTATRSTSAYYYLNNCPLKILYNFPYNTTIELEDKSPTGRFSVLYFEGYPTPLVELYRLGADGVPEVKKGMNVYYSYPNQKQPANVYLDVYDVDKTGKYILTLKQGNITEVVHLDIIKSTATSTTAFPAGTSTTDPRKTTTVLPIRTSTIDSTTTTDRAPDINTTASENKMNNMIYDMDMESKNMLYLGVAGFVMFLMLILILVIVGVFWYIRMKRKPAASVEENQVYSTMQNPSNRPNPIYENLKKL